MVSLTWKYIPNAGWGSWERNSQPSALFFSLLILWHARNMATFIVNHISHEYSYGVGCFPGKALVYAEESLVTLALERKLFRNGPRTLDTRNVQTLELWPKECPDLWQWSLLDWFWQPLPFLWCDLYELESPTLLSHLLHTWVSIQIIYSCAYVPCHFTLNST